MLDVNNNLAGTFNAQTIAVIGIGLIGGSIIKAFRQLETAPRVIAVDLDKASIESARQAQEIAAGYRNVNEMLAAENNIDVIIVCLQPSLVEETVIKLLRKTTALITDVTSIKTYLQSVSERVNAEQNARYISSHPIAGTENSGYSASFPELFKDAIVVICDSPQPLASAENQELLRIKQNNIERLKQIWQAIGGHVAFMSPNEHDITFSSLSHFPHVLSWLALKTFYTASDMASISKFTQGGGLKSMTRLAGSDPKLWSEVFVSNKNNILTDLDIFTAEIKAFRQLLVASEQEEIFKLLSNLKTIRENIWKPQTNPDQFGLFDNNE